MPAGFFHIQREKDAYPPAKDVEDGFSTRLFVIEFWCSVAHESLEILLQGGPRESGK